MTETDQARPIFRSAGYTALVERYGLDVFPNWHTSRVTSSGIRRVDSQAGIIDEVYPHLYWPGDKLGDHLEFALKYDGTNLAILARLFHEAGEEGLLEYIRSKPTGKYARRLWFFVTTQPLPNVRLSMGNQVIQV